jgi:hypothetical protein
MTRTISNFVLFQIGWFACVLGAANSMPWTGVVVAALIVTWHLSRSPRPAPELSLILSAVGIGVVFDTLLVQSGWLVYNSPIPSASFAPVWIIALWCCFATTLNVSMRWMHGRWLVAALLGLVAGPIAYLGGAALGGVEVVALTPALIALGAGWALATPLLVRIASRLDGWSILDTPTTAMARG